MLAPTVADTSFSTEASFMGYGQHHRVHGEEQRRWLRLGNRKTIGVSLARRLGLLQSKSEVYDKMSQGQGSRTA